MRNNKPRRSRPRRDKGSGVSSPSRGRTETRWDAVGKRIDVAYDAIGHPQQATRPVEEGKHYETLAYTDWADTFVPTVVKWNHGAIDSFTDARKSRENRDRAIQHAKASGMSQRIKMPAQIKVQGKFYVEHTGAYTHEEAEKKAKDIRRRGYKAVVRRGNYRGQPVYTVYARKEEA